MEQPSSIPATLITENGDLVPIIVHIPKSGEAVAFPVVPEPAQEGLPKPTVRTRRRRRPSVIIQGAFDPKVQPSPARPAGGNTNDGNRKDDRPMRWVGETLRFVSYEAYGQIFIEQIVSGRLPVPAVPASAARVPFAMRISVPGYSEIPVRVPAIRSSPHGPVLELTPATVAELTPERLARSALGGQSRRTSTGAPRSTDKPSDALASA